MTFKKLMFCALVSFVGLHSSQTWAARSDDLLPSTAELKNLSNEKRQIIKLGDEPLPRVYKSMQVAQSNGKGLSSDLKLPSISPVAEYQDNPLASILKKALEGFVVFVIAGIAISRFIVAKYGHLVEQTEEADSDSTKESEESSDSNEAKSTVDHLPKGL